jgi:hypothetical protein
VTDPNVPAEPNVLAGVVFTHVSKLMKQVTDAARAECNEQWAPSENRAVRHPVTGAVLGFAKRTDPIATARLVDEAAALPWFGDNRPYDLRDVEEVDLTDDEELRAVLREHLPHRLRSVVRITEQGLNAVLKKAESDEDFRPPGIEVTKSTGTTNFYPKNPKGIESLFVESVIGFDGIVRPALTEGDSK